MSKQKQETVNSELASKKSLDPPVIVARRSDWEPETEELAEATVSSRRTQLIALSKVVNRAFTGWTIKTQS